MTNTQNDIALNAYRALVAGVALPETAQVSITNHDPVFPMPLRFGAASASALLAAMGQGVANLAIPRGGPAQKIAVNAEDAAVSGTPVGSDGQRPAVLATAPVITSGGEKHDPVRTVGE